MDLAALVFCIALTVLPGACEQPDDFPANWKDYVAKDMLEKFQGKQLRGFSDRNFQGDIQGVDKTLPPEQLQVGFNAAVSDRSKLWPGESSHYIIMQFEKKKYKPR